VTGTGVTGEGRAAGDTAAHPPGGAHGGRLLHRALVYDDVEHYLRAVGRFVREGLREGDRVLVAAPGARLPAVRDDLGDDAGRVGLLDTAALRPADIFAALAGHVTAGPGRARAVLESGLRARRADEVREILRHEAAVNVVLAGADVTVLCPYDRRDLAGPAAQGVRHTHPEVVSDGRLSAGADFRHPREYAAAAPGDGPPRTPALHLHAVGDVAAARRHVRATATAAGMDPHDADDLAAAVGEVAANAVVHGGGRGTLWCGRERGVVVCVVHDGGAGPEDPLAGYLVPGDEAAEGRGLWLARRLCDSVEVTAGPDGTRVTLRTAVRRPGAR
jgi:anti-sigma regulatory factor (Ser/Thr protein kinase)